VPTWLIVFVAAAVVFGVLRLWRGADDE